MFSDDKTEEVIVSLSSQTIIELLWGVWCICFVLSVCIFCVCHIRSRQYRKNEVVRFDHDDELPSVWLTWFINSNKFELLHMYYLFFFHKPNNNMMNISSLHTQ